MKNLFRWVSARGSLHSMGRDESGQSLALLSISLIVFIAMMGLVLDIGHGIVRQRQMQVAADAAALSGAHDLAQGNGQEIALNRMQEMLVANGADPSSSAFTVSNGTMTDVWARTSVPTLFAGIFGIDTLPVEAYARAAVGQIVESDRLMPFVVEKDEWVLDQAVTLWGDKDGPGNFGWVRWQGQNPNTPTLQSNISNPQGSDVVGIGDMVSGHPGVSFNPIQSYLDAWIGSTVTILLYDPAEIEGSGNNLSYKAAGFARFLITGTHSHGQNSEIYGTFVSYVKFGEQINPNVTIGIQGIGLLE